MSKGTSHYFPQRIKHGNRSSIKVTAIIIRAA